MPGPGHTGNCALMGRLRAGHARPLHPRQIKQNFCNYHPAVPGAAQCSLLTTAVPFLMTLCAACRAAGHSSPPSARMILSCKSCCIFTRFPHNMKTGPRLYPARRREPFGRVQARAFLFSAFVIFPPASARKPPAARRCTPTRRVRPRRRPAPRPPRLLHRTRG